MSIDFIMSWWKIKNKWRRFLDTDESKAYRMIMAKLKGKEGGGEAV